MSPSSPLTACDSQLQYPTGRSALDDDDDADHDADADADGQPEEPDAMDMTGVEHTGAAASSSTVQPSPSAPISSSFPAQPVASSSSVTPSTMQGMQHTMQVNAQPLPISAPAPGGSNMPVKRGRGRPKGSTTKKFLTLPTDGPMPLTLKRPVGRPRKDGLPPGSLTKFKAESMQFSASLTPATVAQPPVTAYPNSFANHTPLFTTVPRPLTSPVSASTSTATPAPPPSHSPGDDVTPAAPAAAAPSSSATPTAPPTTIPTATDDWTVRLSQNPNDFLATLILSLFAPNPSPIVGGPTIEEAFQHHLHSLDLNTNLNLYSSHKTFWVPTSAPYFALTASTSAGGQTPSEYRFFYWDPLPLVFNGIACYYCGSGLTNKGRISSGPIKIYDIDKPFFIIGCEYTCTSVACQNATAPSGGGGRKFASTDATILGFLPGRLFDEFPARLVNGEKDRGTGVDVWNWTAQGVSKPLWNMVVGGLKAGVSKTQLVAQIAAMRMPTWETGGPGVVIAQAQAQRVQSTAANIDPALAEVKKPEHAQTNLSPPSTQQPTRVPQREGELPVDQRHVSSPPAGPSHTPVIDPALHPPPPSINQPPPPNPSLPLPTAPPPPIVAVQPVQNAVYAHHHPFLPFSYMPFHALPPGVPPPVAPVPAPQHQQHLLQHHPPQLQQQLQLPNHGPQHHPGTPSSSATHSPAPMPGVVTAPGPTQHQHTLTMPGPSPQTPSGSHPPTTPSSQTNNQNAPSPVPGSLNVVPGPSTSSNATAGTSSGGPPPSSTHIFASSSISTVSGVTQAKRAPRSCCKCGSQACPGKAQRSYCKNPCRDCGKLDCRGRNSKRPDKTCSEGWG